MSVHWRLPTSAVRAAMTEVAVRMVGELMEVEVAVRMVGELMEVEEKAAAATTAVVAVGSGAATVERQVGWAAVAATAAKTLPSPSGSVASDRNYPRSQGR